MSIRDERKYQEVSARFFAGETLAEIGATYGVSRQCVQQMLKRLGINRRDGGQSVRSNERKGRRAASLKSARDARTRHRYGCNYAEAREANARIGLSNKSGIAWRYIEHKRNAKFRGIEFAMGLLEWIAVWESSGHFHERGRTRSAYVMARRRDSGPYAPWNVYITTSVQNIKDGYVYRRQRAPNQQQMAA